jgi:hypothetical protein
VLTARRPVAFSASQAISRYDLVSSTAFGVSSSTTSSTRAFSRRVPWRSTATTMRWPASGTAE